MFAAPMVHDDVRAFTPPPDNVTELAMSPLAKTTLETLLYRGSTAAQLETALDQIDVDTCDADGENAFFVADLAMVYRQYMRWVRELPQIIPFYAVKCNPEPLVLHLLAALGLGFDCASNGEIQSIIDMGVSPSRIIYANPCKASSFVRRAASQNISLTAQTPSSSMPNSKQTDVDSTSPLFRQLQSLTATPPSSSENVSMEPFAESAPAQTVFAAQRESTLGIESDKAPSSTQMSGTQLGGTAWLGLGGTSQQTGDAGGGSELDTLNEFLNSLDDDKVMRSNELLSLPSNPALKA